MRVRRVRRRVDRYGFLAAGFADRIVGEPRTLAEPDRRPATQIGQRERSLAVTAVIRADQRKQRGVLRDRHYLPLTQRPALRGKITAENADLCDERIHFAELPRLPR